MLERLLRWFAPTSAYTSVHRWEAQTRQCPGCNTVIGMSCAYCPTCGKQQEARETDEISLDEIANQVHRSAFEHEKRNAMIWQAYQAQHPDLVETQEMPVVERPFLAHVHKKQKHSHTNQE